MQINLLFFASLREALQTQQEAVELPAEVVTVGQLRSWLCERGGAWAEALSAERTVRVAVNQNLAASDTVLTEAAEVAFFPPVTGG